MALWKDTNSGFANAAATSTPNGASPQPRDSNVASLPAVDTSRRAAAVKDPQLEPRESLIGGGLTIEGKIFGTGHVRIAGRFKGDVQVDGNVTLDPGSHLEGQINASVVTVGGELTGNIEGAKRVELLETGIVNGDVKAGALTAAAGARLRGQVEVGWEAAEPRAFEAKGFGSA